MSHIVPPEQFNREAPMFGKQRAFNVSQGLNGGIDFGVSTQTNPLNYTGNINGQWANVTTPAGVNTEFSIPHSLGRVPSFYLWISDKACKVYQLPDTGTAWTNALIYLKCDTATVKLRVFII